MKNNIKTIRESKNLTQKECADILGISLRAWQTYEQGVSEPKQELLCKIADMFKVSLDYLLGREKAPDPFGELGLSAEDEQEVFAKYMSLPENVRAILLDVLVQLGSAAKPRSEHSEQQSSPTFWIRTSLNKAAAGYGYDLSNDDEWEDIEILDTELARRADFAVEIEGSSMEPDYHDGDIVLIKLDPDIPVGKVGLFVHEGKGYIKERGENMLLSRNPDYPPIEGESRCVGWVLGIAETV